MGNVSAKFTSTSKTEIKLLPDPIILTSGFTIKPYLTAQWNKTGFLEVVFMLEWLIIFFIVVLIVTYFKNQE